MGRFAKLKSKFEKLMLYLKKDDNKAYIQYLRRHGCKIGEECVFYSPVDTLVDETSLDFIEIGNLVQITRGVIILGHDYSYSVLGNVYYDLPRKQKRTVIGNNVFIGMNAIILNGATVEDNVIIGAGAVVSGRCVANSVYAGNPAKRVCSLEEYYAKCCAGFESGAALWFERKGTMIGPYSALFEGKMEIKGGYGLDITNIEKVKETMKKWTKYQSVDQLIQANEMGGGCCEYEQK